MIITDVKIVVDYRMLERENMTRFGQIGIPVDISDKTKGLIWKEPFDMTEEDCDIIEDYFINKKSK